jgi:hypothetical protein
MISIAPALRRRPWRVGRIARRGASAFVLGCLPMGALTLAALAQAPLTPPSEHGGAPGGAPLVGGTVSSGFAGSHQPGTYCYTQAGWCQLPSAGRPGQQCSCRTSSGQSAAGQVN